MTGTKSIVRAIAAVAAIGVTVLFGSESFAAPAPRQADATELSIISQSFFVRGSANIGTRLLLSGSGIDPTALEPSEENGNQSVLTTVGPVVIVQVFPPITDPVAVEELPESTPLDSIRIPLREIATVADGEIQIDLSIPIDATGAAASDQSLQLSKPGLYPVEIRVWDSKTLATAATFINKTEDEVQPEDQLAAALIVGVDDIGPVPTEEDRQTARDQVQRLVDLAELTELPLTVILPPSIVDHVLNPDPDLTRAVTDALRGQTILGAPSFALQPDAAIGASITDDLKRAWAAGVDKLTANFPDSTIDTSTMVIDAPTSVDGIAILREIGMGFGVVPYSVYRSADGQIGDFTDPGLLVQLQSGNGSAVPAAIGSQALGLLEVDDSTDSAPPGTATERAIRLLAHLTAQQTSPSTGYRSVFLMTPEIGLPDPDVIAAIETLSATAEATEPNPAIVFSSVSAIVDRTESHLVNGEPVTIAWPVGPSSVIVSRLVHVDAAESAVQASVSMLPAEDPRRDSWVWRVRSAESTRLSDEQAGELLADSLAQAEQLRQAVPPPEPFEFTLTGADTTLRFQLTNNAATPLDVVFRLKSDRLIAPQETAVRLTPNAVTDVPIEVSARSNGSATVQVQVVTPDGLALFAPVEMNGRVATFGGVGQLVTVGALLVLASWWLSFLARRSRAEQPSSVDADDQLV